MSVVFSPGMRTPKNCGNRSVHISDTENLVAVEDAGVFVQALVEWRLHYIRSRADSLSLTLERVDNADILHLDALPVTTVETHAPEVDLR